MVSRSGNKLNQFGQSPLAQPVELKKSMTMIKETVKKKTIDEAQVPRCP